MSIFNKNSKAFTIIELIVVVAILGTLVLLAGPKLLGYVEKAELTRIQHDVKVMENKMADVLNQDNNYNEWDDNEKDLGTLILRNQLFEKEGLATRVDKSHLMRGVNVAQSDSELGVGGSLIDLGDSETTGYKIIPDEFKTAIGTRLKGTFYSNENGKVYLVHNKPLRSIRQEQALAYVSSEDLDYEFSVISGKGTITGYNGTLTHLYIPSAFLIDDECVPVQVIGAGAFSNSGTLVRVYIPQSVERIEERAFEGNKLTQVEIPHSVNYIGENAFYNNNLSSKTIVIKNESSTMTIVHGAFSGQPSGEVNPVYSPVTDKDLGIVFDRSTGTIVASTGRSASRSGSNDRNNYESYVRIPRTIVVENVVHEVKEIAQGAYQGQGIIFVEFPDTLERIEDYAFAGNQLIKVTIPSSVGHVGNYAFAYNEINGERTIDFVEIENQGKFEDYIDNLGNITSNGVKRNEIGNANLLDQIFITSSANFEIPEEYNPGIMATLEISIESGAYMNTQTNISFSHSYEEIAVDEEWELNGTLLTNKPYGKLSVGEHTLKVRVLYETGNWSKWSSVTFNVTQYNQFITNHPNSNIVNNFEYNLGDDLVFNYTNSDNLNWEVEKSGTYLIEVWGAGSSGGGARVSGKLELAKGDLINFKIHSKSNGGGAPGGGNAKYGSAGTIIKLNNEMIIAAGGAGGEGGRAGGSSVGYAYGGAGGNGGLIGSHGSSGQGRQTVSSGWWYGEAGGTSPSRGGSPSGGNGRTIYDGGGGGRDGFVGGGGGAGGSSFLHEDLVNPVITDGYNSENGKVIITYIGK